MRTTVRLLPLLLLPVALLTGGCATSSKTAGVRWFSKVPNATAAKEPEEKNEPATAAKDSSPKSNPFQSSESQTAAAKDAKKTDDAKSATAATDRPAGKDAGTDKLVAKPAKPAGRDGGTEFSPETMQLIHDELRDAAPAEREQWYAQLKRVSPDVIPEILRARRLSLQVAEADHSPAIAANVSARTPPTAPAGNQFTDLEAAVRARDGVAAPPARNTPQPWPASFDAPPAATAARSTPGDASAANSVQPAGHSSPTDASRVIPAYEQAAANAPRPSSHAVYRVDPRQAENPVVLQGFEADGAGAPIAVQRNLTPEQRAAYAGMTPPRQNPSGVPWPAPPATPRQNSPNGITAVAAQLPFGAGIVQSVAGLVPNRGAATAPPTALPAAPPNGQTVAEWRMELDRATALLEQQVALLSPGSTLESQAEYLRQHVQLRLLYLVGGHQERALTAIPQIDAAEQEFWQQVFWGTSNALDSQHIPRPQDRATQTISQFNAAVRRLQEKADLQVRNVAFCSQIQDYGNYERFPRDEFTPGQEVLLYAEVENFKSEPTADGQYRTLLRSTIELLSPSGEVRKQIEFPATEDLCRNYRRDYFHNYQFTIPNRLPLGPHVLKLTVFDELSGKMVSHSLNLLVK